MKKRNTRWDISSLPRKKKTQWDVGSPHPAPSHPLPPSPPPSHPPSPPPSHPLPPSPAPAPALAPAPAPAPILRSSLSPPPSLCGLDKRGRPIVELLKTVRFPPGVKEVSPPPMPGSRPPPPSGPSTQLLRGDAATQTRAVGDRYMVSRYLYDLQTDNISVLETLCVDLREQGNEEVANAVAAQVAFYRMIGQ